MNKQNFIIFLFTFISSMVYSQSPTWQWVRGGGSQGSPVSSNLDEDCHWLGTDQSGNIYGMSMIFYSDIQIDTSHMAHGFGFDDFAVFSYRCDGNFRWARYFGGAVLDVAWCMCTDKDGNTYVVGGVAPYMNSPTHYGDSTCPAGTPGVEPIFIVKIDSTGHTVWIHFVPSTAPLSLGFFDARQDSEGNICILAGTNHIGTWGSFTFSGRGYYVAKLNKDTGNIIGLTKLELVGRIHGPVFSLDEENSYYISWAMGDDDTIAVGNDTLAPAYNVNLGGLAKFDSAGIALWLQSAGGNYWIFQGKYMYGRPALKGGNVYLFGEAQRDVDFLGTVVNNPNDTSHGIPIPLVVSFRQDNGHFIRLKQLYPHHLTVFDALTTTSSGIALGGWTGIGPTIYNQSDTLKPMSTFNTAYPFLMEIDTGLTWFSWALATRANNASTRIQSMITDINGNIYAGGLMGDSLYPTTGQGIRKHGGPNDFFLAKISGNPDCGCVLATPKPQLQGMDGFTVSMTGTATGQLDSLYWDWGDGTVTHYLNQNTVITHTYASGGTYSLCLKAYNYCGIRDSCLSINGLGINNPELPLIRIYPNPSTDRINVDNPYSGRMQLTLYNIIGEKQYYNSFENHRGEIDLGYLPKGIYVLEVLLQDGRKTEWKIVKE
ncbi:MAG: T9SS type A sorting domain-containing protein [Bacteroidetes bacterium]|nr:T9SS type A sorting domain-containing protein [Bacteroidota bacterium]